jgi:hypothetical protein
VRHHLDLVVEELDCVFLFLFLGLQEELLVSKVLHFREEYLHVVLVASIQVFADSLDDCVIELLSSVQNTEQR